jgi:hypothetical protein
VLAADREPRAERRRARVAEGTGGPFEAAGIEPALQAHAAQVRERDEHRAENGEIRDGPRGRRAIASTLTLAPGAHRVELRRPGYLSAQRELTLGDGASGEVALEPEEDRAALGAGGATLALAISEPDAVVTVDGRSRGPYAAPLRLSSGVHRVLIERGGFLSIDRDVDLEAGRTTTITAGLDPTPETRAAFVGRAVTQRTWGIIATVGGAALGDAGAGWLVWNGSQKSEKKATYDQAVKDARDGTASGPCTAVGHLASGAATVQNPAACSAIADDADAAYKAARGRDVYGWVGVGVGAAAAVTGVVLLLTGDDPRRYDHKPTDFAALKPRAIPVGWAAPGAAGAAIVGTF